MNYVQYFFEVFGIGVLILGLITLYGDDYLPNFIMQIFAYGRANQMKEKEKSKLLRFIEMPKSWFAHFYIYAVLLQLMVVFTLIRIYQSSNPAWSASSSYLFSLLNVIGGEDRAQTVDSTTTLLASILFLFQVSRRLYECWFVSVFSGTKMNVIHYILAFAHYTCSVFSIISHSIGFTSIGQDIISPPTASSWTLSFKHLDIFHALGVMLFLYGSYQQNSAHHQYADLRKGNKKEIVSYAHRIPTGGLFEVVSCPNYLAEILIYMSLSVVFGFANMTWNAIVLWVVCNQIVSAIMNHRWYLKTFPDYPKERKAIIPYVW